MRQFLVAWRIDAVAAGAEHGDGRTGVLARRGQGTAMRGRVDAQGKSRHDGDPGFAECLRKRLGIALALRGGGACAHHGQPPWGAQQRGIAQGVKQGRRVGDVEQALRISRIVQGDAGLPRLGGPLQGACDEVLGFAVGVGQQRRGDGGADHPSQRGVRGLENQRWRPEGAEQLARGEGANARSLHQPQPVGEVFRRRHARPCRRPLRRSGLGEAVGDFNRFVGRQDERIGHMLEGAKHHHHAHAAVGQFDLGFAGRRRVFDHAAVVPQRQHVAALQPVVGPAVERDHAVLGRHAQIAVDRDNVAADRLGRGVGGVVDEFTRRRDDQPVAHADFTLDAIDPEHRHRIRPGGRLDQIGRAEIFGLVGDDFFRGRVDQRLGRTIDLIARGLAHITAHIDLRAGRRHGVPLGQGHDARRGFEGVGFDDQRLGEEGRDKFGRDGGNAFGRQQAGFDLRIELHRGDALAAAAHGEAGAAIGNVEIQHLPRKNPVRVADLLQIHAPQLGPVPGLAQVHA